MRTTHRAIALVYATLALSIACTPEDDPSPPPPPPPPCSLAEAGEACAAPGDCCSGNCQHGICVAPVGQCAPVAAACAVPSDCCLGACNSVSCVDPNACEDVGATCGDPTECCTGNCAAGFCAEPENACLLLGTDCTSGPQCCSGTCADLKCTVPPVATCRGMAEACTSDAQCCSASCDDVTHACTNPAGICNYPGEQCASDSDCCSQNCPNAGTPGATCSAALCRQTSQSCVDDAQCCSGICGAGNLCEAVPVGSSNGCKTLGESCAAAADCCSTNCQGGICKAAASCNATGDVCARPEDCCSGLCDQTPGEPGRCRDASGGCALDGYPCTSDSGCCTRRCVDLGTGAKVCQPSGGCRLNGNYCDSTDACCNVNHLVAESQWIQCDPADHVCDNGGSCNPPGDICGLGVNASQNCCFGKKDVCKYDSNGIPRCFGGPPNHCTDASCDEVCPTGWDANDPQCCIQPGEICQFRDQCCGGTPCVADLQGVLRCAETATTCLPRGASCSSDPAPSGQYTPVQGPCCDGSECRWVNELGWACSAPIPGGGGGTCSLQGEACGGSNPACCFGECVSGVCGADCRPNGNACAGASECCSGVCDNGTCRAVCVPEAGSCTISADCCEGFTCDVPAGATSGTCKSGGSSTCAETGLSCVTDPCCNPADTCTSGVCTPPAPACSETGQQCTPGGGECCSPLKCYTYVLESRVDCTAGATNCFCDPEAVCYPLGEPCSTLVGCCSGYCAQNVGGAQCSSTDPTQCTCRPIG